MNFTLTDNFLVTKDDFVESRRINLNNELRYEDILRSEIYKLRNQETREDYCLVGHNEGVTSIVSSPDFKYLASCSKGKTIKIWNLEEKREESFFTDNKDSIVSLVFSPDGKYLVTGLFEGMIKIWDFKSYKEEFVLTGHTQNVRCLIFTPDGKFLISGSDDFLIKVWNIEEKHEEFSFTGNKKSVISLAMSPDGKYFASGSFESIIKIWNLEKKQLEKTLNTNYIVYANLAFNPHGNYLASGWDNNRIKIWDLEDTTNEILFSGHTKTVVSLAFSPQGNYLVSGSYDNLIKIWNVLEKREEYTLQGHTDLVGTLTFSQDGNYFASGSLDKAIKIWNLKEKKEDCILSGHESSVMSIAFSPDTKYIVSGSYDKAIKIWSIPEKKEVFSLIGHTKSVASVTFSPDGRFLASGSYDNTIKVWNLSQNQEEYTLEGHTQVARAVLYSPDGKFLASASYDNTIKIWDLAQRKEDFSLTGHTKSVLSLSYSKDGRYLVTGSNDNTVKLWNLIEKRQEFSFNGHTQAVPSVLFSPDTKNIISGSYDKIIKIWNLEEKREEYSLAGHAKSIRSLSLSPYGNYLASGSDDFTIKIWNLKEKREEFSLDGHNQSIGTVAFSPDGKLLASGSDDNTVRIWNLVERRSENLVTGDGYWINRSFIDQKGIFFTDIDDKKFNQSLRLSTAPNSSPLCLQYYFIGPSNTFDHYYQKKSLFYNLLDGIKSQNFSNVLPLANNLLVTQYTYSAIHFLCFYGKLQALKTFLNETCEIKADLFGKSPFYYCIKKKFHDCTDYLLNFLISLLSSESPLDSTRVKSSLYAIRNDFTIIIESSSTVLVAFLEKLLIVSDNTFTEAGGEFPIIQYSNIMVPAIQTFINFSKSTEEIPVVLQTSLFPIPDSLNSLNAFGMMRAIHSCSNKTIFVTPFIQYYIKFYWESLVLWIGFYSILVFLNTTAFLLVLLVDKYHSYALIPFIATNSLLFIWEIFQLKSEKLKYFNSVANFLDLIRVFFTAFWISLQFLQENPKENSYYEVLTLIVASLNFIKSFKGFCKFDSTRYYVRLIPMALKDIRHFLIIFSYTTFIFGVLFFISRSQEDYNSLWAGAFALNFGGSEFGSTFLSLEYPIFFLATIINVVLMLNLLISILGDSYDRFQMNQVQLDYEQRTEFILEVLEVRSVFYKCVEWTEGKFLHICNLSSAGSAGDDEVWEGKLKYLDSKWDYRAQALKQKIGSMDNVVNQIKYKTTAIENIVKQEIGTVNRSISSLENKVNSIEEKLGLILNLVTK
jgi:WD40 repeat protein